ncbi:leucine carboxyl methyltransferase family protein [Mycobacterium intracellulare 1956]|uniref:Leucine carboxyl methyltransferase family protein n=1 Tax=Mycobacterium intracellulare 1956 TaxID=1299331 RepID=X8CJ28_MYCIT|nr:class I SAM-dependent methyltransferase [Mycobacterium intracellulare]ASW86428.1 class I SAM-dependent methyltransferase [Mycobacterium intracellulare]EUA31945.1 leucine carboxyl methyltransferase family protein [Mycobacterium intracellulare]EUA55443.1 leucine carboxyl methyltransferase family protein [Mycobacterium intracellulare 1956]
MTATDSLSPLQKTLLITLTGRALDTRKERPILGDRLAARVCGRLGSDVGVVKVPSSVTLATALRSAMLDRAVRDFIAAHPNAVVVELGCGLETRMHRVAPPPAVDWYDVDFANVIELRRRVLPELSRTHLIAASLADPKWLRSIPTDRPVIAVADGVVGLLSEAENGRLLAGLSDHFQVGGEFVFNAYTKLAARLMGSVGVLRAVGIPKGYRGFGFDDPRELERLAPRMTFVDQRTGVQAPEVANLPWGTRITAKLFARWPAQARRGVWILRYRW